MPLAYSSTFFWHVTAGLILTLLGAALLLAVGVWWTAACELAQQEPAPWAFLVVRAAGFTLFVTGLMWQLIGYLRLEYAGWW